MSWKFWGRRPNPMPSPDSPEWERALINRLALEHLRDQRRGRRWGILFKFLILLYLIALLVAAYSQDLIARVSPSEDHTAVIDIKGVIAPETDASADRVITALRKAFETDQVKGIVLRINSPGGSPVQAGYIHDEIVRLKAKYKKDKDAEMPVHAVATDVCASAGYYIAVAADAIHVDKASLVGSIGVRIGSFGFDEAIKSLGIERRLLTAGENKGILDPFSPLPPEQRIFVQAVLDDLHGQFIEVVRAGRGDRLDAGEEVFSGLFWSGEEALELGLVDALGSASSVARDLVGAEKLVDYTVKRDLFETFSRRLGASFGAGLIEGIGMRGVWSIH
ncbi:MAG: S49 family peptidase [Sphingobacteriia bacterium]|nr:S49 family peptidase [Sphingobacteriia bacterium]NCC38267.1 S49 family peptidase [Gammaproteobacteria bacterium]